MKTSLSIGTAFLLLVSTLAHADPLVNCLHGCPSGAPSANQLVDRDIYTLSNNPVTKFADWVAYKVDPDNFENAPSRSRNWAKDDAIDADNTLVPSEYDDANVTLAVDRGHQAPLGSFKGSPDWRQPNFLSNITPQATKLNQGAWKDLEDAIRDMATDNALADVFVMTGPLFEWPMAKLPGTNKDHEVPSSYWKVVALKQGTDIKVAAFYFYQDTPKRADYCDHMKSVDLIEAKSGLDFFAGLTNSVESDLESGRPGLVSELGC